MLLVTLIITCIFDESDTYLRERAKYEDVIAKLLDQLIDSKRQELDNLIPALVNATGRAEGHDFPLDQKISK